MLVRAGSWSYLRGGMVSPSLFGLACYGFLGLWLFVGTNKDSPLDDNHLHSNNTTLVVIFFTMSTPPLTMASSEPQTLTSVPRTEMSADKRHTVLTGNCHCGRYRFEYLLPAGRKLQDEAVKCSCRLCFMKGYIWLPVRESTPSGDELIWTRNDGELIKNSAPMINDEVSVG